jgi:hypothetical protein
MQVSKYLL